MNSETALDLIRELDSELFVVIPFEAEVPEELLVSLHQKGYVAYTEITSRGPQIVVTSRR